MPMLEISQCGSPNARPDLSKDPPCSEHRTYLQPKLFIKAPRILDLRTSPFPNFSSKALQSPIFKLPSHVLVSKPPPQISSFPRLKLSTNIHSSRPFSPTTWFRPLLGELAPFFRPLKLRASLVCGHISIPIYLFTSQTKVIGKECIVLIWDSTLYLGKKVEI